MYEEITQHIFSRGTQRQIKEPLREQASSGFLHRGAIVVISPSADRALIETSSFEIKQLTAEQTGGKAWPALWSITIFSRIHSWNKIAHPTGVNLFFQHKCMHSLFPGRVCSAHTQKRPSEEHISQAPLLSHRCSKALPERVWFSQLSPSVALGALASRGGRWTGGRGLEKPGRRTLAGLPFNLSETPSACER